MTDQPAYKTSPSMSQFHECTQIYVRAQNEHGQWINADIAELTPESLAAWANTVSPENLARILVQMCREWQWEAFNIAADRLEKIYPQFSQFTAQEVDVLKSGALLYDKTGDYWEKDRHDEWKLYQFETALPRLPEDGEPYTLVHE